MAQLFDMPSAFYTRCKKTAGVYSVINGLCNIHGIGLYSLQGAVVAEIVAATTSATVAATVALIGCCNTTCCETHTSWIIY